MNLAPNLLRPVAHVDSAGDLERSGKWDTAVDDPGLGGFQATGDKGGPGRKSGKPNGRGTIARRPSQSGPEAVKLRS